jgi:hypothetical protein
LPLILSHHENYMRQHIVSLFRNWYLVIPTCILAVCVGMVYNEKPRTWCFSKCIFAVRWFILVDSQCFLQCNVPTLQVFSHRNSLCFSYGGKNIYSIWNVWLFDHCMYTVY